MYLTLSIALLAGCGALSGNKVETLNMEGFKSAMSDGNTVIVDTRGDSVYNGFKSPNAARTQGSSVHG